MKPLKQIFKKLLFKDKYVSTEKECLKLEAFFKNKTLQKQYASEGYLVLKDFANPIIDILISEYNNLQKGSEKEFQYSTMANNSEVNIELHHKLSKIIENSIGKEIFNQYRLLSSTYLIKPAITGTEMDLHQDWSFTLQDKYTAATIWIPLQDVSKENGCVFLLPKTHRIKESYRSHTLPTTRIKRYEKLESYIQSMELKKGDILIFNPSIFHGSYSNTTPKDRIALAITAMPKDAPFIYADYKGGKDMALHHWGDNDILKQMNDIVNYNSPISSSKVDSTKYTNPQIEEKELVRFLKLQNDEL